MGGGQGMGRTRQDRRHTTCNTQHTPDRGSVASIQSAAEDGMRLMSMCCCCLCLCPCCSLLLTLLLLPPPPLAVLDGKEEDVNKEEEEEEKEEEEVRALPPPPFCCTSVRVPLLSTNAGTSILGK